MESGPGTMHRVIFPRPRLTLREKINGKNFKYFENGKTEIEANYIDNNLVGEYLYYNNKGGFKTASVLQGREIKWTLFFLF